MVKRSHSSTPVPSDDTNHSPSTSHTNYKENINESDKDQIAIKPLLSASPKMATVEKKEFSLESKRIATEMILEAGYNSVDFNLMSERTGLTVRQLRDTLRNRTNGKTNLRFSTCQFSQSNKVRISRQLKPTLHRQRIVSIKAERN
ncbi:uncharacterized protein IL334_000976 [Kwoniella shivajii]|uniref:HTH psq-type domain-containing protein n=1 Tax=Kwoniella shivajii TaxID=564305 RepID=A0ABZ1CR87_9TREE|nr:hypothetical protein IL334_000976 [Kwoniella shivajii]